MSDVLLKADNLVKYFPLSRRLFSSAPPPVVKAVDGVSFSIYAGETLGLVGESGCGKSTTGRLLLRLIEPTAGRVWFQGVDITNMNQKQMRPIRKDMQIIFQDPYGSLNPRITVEHTISEPLEVHGIASGAEKRKRVHQLLEMVGLSDYHAKRYPHEFSGGQRQRVGIARALAANPKLVVCDEPVSALDVSIQAQVLNLLQDLQEQLGLTYLFISHDLSVVEHVSDRVAVMYLGKIVELAHKKDIYTSPKHPYTKALMSAAPKSDPLERQQRIVLEGDVPTPISPPPGCTFHPRCPSAMDVCHQKVPTLSDLGQSHWVACHCYDEATGAAG